MIRTIELNEEEVNEAILSYLKEKGVDYVIKLTYCTSVDGDYDRGTAREFVKSVIVEY